MSGKKRSLARAKAQQGYDSNIPRCKTCVHRKPEVQGVPAQFAVSGVQTYQPPRCKIGYFAVHDYGVCDLWKSKQGETLETP